MRAIFGGVAAVEEGADILILSDRDMSAEKMAIPVLLAAAAVHHRLVAAVGAPMSGWFWKPVRPAKCMILPFYSRLRR